MDNSFQSGTTPAATPLPEVSETPAAPETPAVPVAPATKKNSKIALIIVVVSIISIAIIATVVAILVLNNSKKDSNDDGGASGAGARSNVNFDTVKNYCSNNKMLTVSTDDLTSEQAKSTLSLDALKVGSNSVESAIMCIDARYNEGYVVSHYVYGENVLIDDLLDKMYADSYTILDKADGYEKAFVSSTIYSSTSVSYMIVENNKLTVANAGTEEKARNILVELGFPDQTWYDGQKTSSTSTKKGGTNAQAKTERKNAMSRIISQLSAYVVNNRKAPSGLAYRESGKSKCYKDSGATGCTFIEKYLEDFEEDPDGVPYGVMITENLYDNKKITTTFESNKSYLRKTNNGYEIEGDDPLSEHMVYIVPGGKCNSYGMVEKGSSARSVAVLYYLGNNSQYCVANE